MDAFLVTARVVLAAVFGAAGLAKISDRAGARQSMHEFGVPRLLVNPAALLLPFLELMSAAALLTTGLAWWGALTAFSLLALFNLAIVVNLAQGRTPDCHCFGKLHSEPVGWFTVGRNTVLAGLAAFIVWPRPQGAGPGLLAWLGGLSSIQMTLVILAVAVVLIAAVGITVLLQLLAQNGRLMNRVEALEKKLGTTAAPSTPGIPVGEAAPAFNLSGADGVPVSLNALAALGTPVLLVFTDAGCTACEQLLPDVARWQRDHRAQVTVAVVGRGDADINRQKAQRHGVDHALQEIGAEVAESYHVKVVPSAVVINAGSVASELAEGSEAIADLVFRYTLPPAVKPGDVAPPLRLRDLDGNAVELTASSGRKRLLLFWNPQCGYCKEMLKDIRSWERTRPSGAPELVVISTGSVDANREQGFRSTVLLDPVFGTGQVFGATGTPSAVLLDEQNRMFSAVDAGAPAVFDRLGFVPRVLPS